MAFLSGVHCILPVHTVNCVQTPKGIVGGEPGAGTVLGFDLLTIFTRGCHWFPRLLTCSEQVCDPMAFLSVVAASDRDQHELRLSVATLNCFGTLKAYTGQEQVFREVYNGIGVRCSFSNNVLQLLRII